MTTKLTLIALLTFMTTQSVWAVTDRPGTDPFQGKVIKDATQLLHTTGASK